MENTAAARLAGHLRQGHSGGNWCCVSVAEVLEGMDRQDAVECRGPGHSSATLLYHITYYVRAVSGVLAGSPLTSKDALSFDAPTISSEEDWNAFKASAFADAEILAAQIAALPDAKLDDVFTNPKYGTYYRNLQGVIGHIHYQLGQMALLKKHPALPTA